MSPLLLAVLLTQTPQSLTVPPVAPATGVPAPSAAVAESPEVGLFAQFVERHLLAIGASGLGFEVRQRERVFRIQDDDFETAFTLVPDALTAARGAHEDFVVASRLQIAGLAVVGASLVLTVSALLVRSAATALIISALVAAGVGLVITLIALPFALAAQSKFFASVASYNQGLLELRPPPGPGAAPSAAYGTGLTFALPN